MREHRFAAAAAATVALEATIRLIAGEPYLGATALLLIACGLSLVPFLPAALHGLTLRLAALPTLACVLFSILLTTVSIVGIPLTELSIRLAVAGLLLALAVVRPIVLPREDDAPRASSSRSREAIALVALAGVVVLVVAASSDIVGPFPHRGTDWGHYLLYAEEVESQQGLLLEDPLAGEEGRLFADAPAVGSLYGGSQILDGISSRSVGSGVILVSVLAPLAVYAAVGALFGLGAGLAAVAAYAVAPIRLEPLYWYGLQTMLALASIALIVLALGLAYRGQRDRRTIVLLALSVLGVAVAHSTSTVVVAVLLALVVAADVILALVTRRTAFRAWWRDSVARTVAAAGVLAAFVGAGVLAHLRMQAADLGPPVSYRFFEPDWLDLDAFTNYYSWEFLALVAVSVALVVTKAGLRTHAALAAVVALATASVVVSQLWRLHVPFEYRRSVYYLGLAMVVVIGVAAVRLGSLRSDRRNWLWIAGYVGVLAYIAHGSIGLRLPQRVLSGENERVDAAPVLLDFREQLDRGELPDTKLVVTDRCLHFVVPYLLRRPTIAAFEEWQVGFESRVPLARTAATILRGGPEGRRLADRLGVGYVVVDPECTPDPAAGLGGTAVHRSEEVAIIRLPAI